MSISSAFLWRFLDDVWDLLPSRDRALFETYWSAQLQIAGNLQQKVLDTTLSTTVNTIPVYRTERWNQFVMNDENCDLFDANDTLTLTLFVATSLSRATAFYETLKVTVPTGMIFQEEAFTFNDQSVRNLRYGKLNGTFSVRIGAQEYTENRDYVVNRTLGTIQALEDGRLPIDVVATVRYFHEEYTRGLDYEVDELLATVVRLVGTTIASGASVKVTYTYNNTATLSLQGDNAAILVDLTTFIDTTKDFSALLPDRTLTIESGPNAGTYPIAVVLSSTSVQIGTSFVSAQDGEVVYHINAFPHGMRVDKRIVSIPTLQDLIDNPALVMVEGTHHLVNGGILSSRTAFPLEQLGPREERFHSVWAERTLVNHEFPYRNFGVLIDFYRTNSEAYKLALQGLWYAFWTGSTPGNLQRGLHILLGLPFVKNAGTVLSVVAPTITLPGEVKVKDPKGRVITYVIPAGLDLAAGVAAGAAVARFDSLSTGVQIIDRNNEPGFVAAHLGRPGINRYLTSEASLGPGDTDETKALTLLEHHLFLPQVLTAAITSRINVTELTTFLDNLKPAWTEYVFSFNDSGSDTIIFLEEIDNDWAIDLTATVGSNEERDAWDDIDFLVFRTTGEIIGGGTQALGNFRDVFVDFAAFGVEEDDIIRISSGVYKGYHRVLARISSTVLSIDIPDLPVLVAAAGLEYVILQDEFRLGHDSVMLKREHIILPGTEYFVPTSLNTKTDVDFSILKNEDVKAMLLVDITNVGAEVQVITDADVDLGEIDVATPPAVAVQDHEVSSAALKRVDNSGPTVTHAFAI